MTPLGNGVRIDAYFGAQPYRLLADRGSCVLAPDWHWNFKHRAESERGLDDAEDLFCPATFAMTLAAGEAGTLTLTTCDVEPLPKDQAPPRHIDEEACVACGTCLHIGCPAIEAPSGLPQVNTALCAGCDLCERVCYLDLFSPVLPAASEAR